MLDSILSAAEPTSTPTTPNSQDVTAALDVITERGDIILQLGKDEESLNLLVSSVALGLASPVFEAMFDGRFAEGQSLSTNSPQTIPLPDDNPECVAMLCMIVHMRTEELPKTLSATKLADFAVVCDKYCCVSAVQAWARIWTAEYLSNSNSKDFEKILFVTYVLRLAKEFKQATQSIIRDRTKVLSINAATHAHNFLPAMLFDGISKERERCQEESLAAFSVGTSELKSSALSLCPRMISVAGVFLQKLKDAQLWPLGNTSLESLKERARDMGKIEQPSSKCHCYPDQEHRASNIHQQLLAELERLYNSVGGFCVECVKLGSCDDTHPCSHDLAPDVES